MLSCCAEKPCPTVSLQTTQAVQLAAACHMPSRPSSCKADVSVSTSGLPLWSFPYFLVGFFFPLLVIKYLWRGAKRHSHSEQTVIDEGTSCALLPVMVLFCLPLLGLPAAHRSSPQEQPTARPHYSTAKSFSSAEESTWEVVYQCRLDVISA